MTRKLTVAAAQPGPIARSESRATVVARLIALLQDAKRRGCALVVFPEMAASYRGCFAFAKHRRPDLHTLMATRSGIVPADAADGPMQTGRSGNEKGRPLSLPPIASLCLLAR